MKIYVWEFKPFDGNETDSYTIFELMHLSVHMGLKTKEMQNVIFGTVGQPVSIKNVGIFKRIE